MALFVFPIFHARSNDLGPNTYVDAPRELDFNGCQNMVTGVVIDKETQIPLPGVSVMIKGEGRGASTDQNGIFSLSAQPSDVLLFSFIGFKTLEISVGASESLNVVMESDVRELNEVVVNAGYWSVKERESTGSIVKVKGDEFDRRPISNPLNALQGKVAGVYLQQTSGLPGSSVKIQIRGLNSLNNGTEPLFVVDGVPFGSQRMSSAYTSNALGANGVSPLNSINPNDIESIEVLKDADATAIYGSRGANGVVLITTKRGRSGGTSVDLNIYSGVGEVTRLPKLLGLKQYLSLRREGFANDGVSPTAETAPDLMVWDTTRSTDWQRKLLGGTSNVSNFQASISGGSEQTQFRLGSGYYTETSVFPGRSRFSKLSGALSVNHGSKDGKFVASMSVSYTSDDNNLPFNDFSYQARILPPNAPKIFSGDGELNWEGGSWSNPFAELEMKYDAQNRNILTSTNLSYLIFKGARLKVNFGFNNFDLTEKTIVPNTASDPKFGLTSANSYLRTNQSRVATWIAEPQLDFDRKLGRGHLSLTLGSTVQKKNTNQFVFQAYGFSSNALLESPKSASYLSVLDDNILSYRYVGFFGRLNYAFDERYIVNITGRRDGSSRFGPSSRYASFGAFGVAWVVSNENWIKEHLPLISFWKLRASYGTSGNDQIGENMFLDTFGPIDPYHGVVAIAPTKLFNENYEWEVNRKFEVAVDFALVQDRVMVSVNHFHNRSRNQLMDYKLPLITGFPSILDNLNATIQNSGWEFVLETENIRAGDFRWITNFNITFPVNKLIRFPGLKTSTYASRYILGQPITIARLYQSKGVDPSSGVYTFEDLNDDGSISGADMLAYKNIGQKYFGGIDNSFTYRGFTLSVFLQFVKQTGLNYLAFGSSPGGMNNELIYSLNRWTKEGDVAEIQRASAGNDIDAFWAGIRYSSSDKTVADASFMRLKNIYLSYMILKGKMNIKTCKLFVQAQNIATLTRYKGGDPEVQSIGSLPPLRVLSAGVNIGL